MRLRKNIFILQCFHIWSRFFVMFGTFASRANFGCSRKGYNLYARGSLGKAIPTRVIKLWRLLLQLRYQRRIEQQMKSRACLVAVETIHELDTALVPCTQMDFELFFNSSYYLSASRGARGVKKTRRTKESINLCVFAQIVSPN